MIEQLAFDLPPKQQLSREDFLISPTNSLALAAIDDWLHWPEGKMLLVGPRGAGKTHLAQIWANQTGAQRITGQDLSHGRLDHLANQKYLVMEDAQTIAGNTTQETGLFHLHNMILPHGRLLITADRPPRDWNLQLPDLMSRMQACALNRLEAPDDMLLSGVLTKLFSDRQILVAPALIPYLVARMPRSIDAARAIVARLDSKALAKHSPISLRLAAEVLENIQLDE